MPYIEQVPIVSLGNTCLTYTSMGITSYSSVTSRSTNTRDTRWREEEEQQASAVKKGEVQSRSKVRFRAAAKAWERRGVARDVAATEAWGRKK